MASIADRKQKRYAMPALSRFKVTLDGLSGELADISEGGMAFSIPVHPDAPAEGAAARGSIHIGSSDKKDFSGTVVRVDTDSGRLMIGVKFDIEIEIPGPILAVVMAEEY